MSDCRQQGFSYLERRRWLQEAADDPVDLLVVGGGITGAGVAREAALAGLSVLLIDKGDFASGTSSRSSKLVHGGLRYLAQGDLALVKEAARERAVLRRLAPHLVRPIPMMLPASSMAGRMKLQAGLWTFDRLAGKSAEGGFRTLDRNDTLSCEPGLRSDRLAGSVLFNEYTTNDARLTLETIKSASSFGAKAANYSELESVTHGPAGVKALIRDRVSDESLQVSARAAVNAAGPWFDRVSAMLDSSAKPQTQLTRGIHLVVPHETLPANNLVALRSPDGRPTFVVPCGDLIYIGTTDTHYEGSLEEPGVSDADVDYLLESVLLTFAEGPKRSDIVGVWSGVRPLLREEGKDPSEISRKDEVKVGPGPIVSIVGGKLTTYRKMAERVLAKVCDVIRRAPEAERSSKEVSLIGGSADEQAAARALSTSAKEGQEVNRLWGNYGLEALKIVSLMERGDASADRLFNGEQLTAAELAYMVDHEMVIHVDDVLRRRNRVGMFETANSVELADAVARELGGVFSWSDERVDSERDEFVSARQNELERVRGERS